MFNLKSIWKINGNIPADLENRIQTLETDNTTNKANIATNTTNITALQNKTIQWTQIMNLTTGNIPNTEQIITLSFTNNHTYALKFCLKTAGDKQQEYVWIFNKEDINWKCSPTFTFYNDLDFTTKTGDFKIVIGMGPNTTGKLKIAQPSGQTVGVSNGMTLYIGEVN